MLYTAVTTDYIAMHLGTEDIIWKKKIKKKERCQLVDS